MSRIATQADFQQNWYSDVYQRYPFFAERAETIRGRFVNQSILIAGCGYGYLVDELRALGINAWGFDASAYAVQQAATIVPGRVTLADTLSRQQLSAARTFAGLSGNQRFGAVITEDLLPCLTLSEIPTALAELRRISGALFHIITCANERDEGIDAVAQGWRVPEMTWLSATEWKQLVGNDKIYDVERQVII